MAGAALTQLFNKIDYDHPESDFRIRCSDDTTFYCHKLILQQHERFSGLPHFKEFTEKEISLNFEPSLMYTMICFVYTGKLDFDARNRSKNEEDLADGHGTVGPSVQDLVKHWSCLDYFMFDRKELVEAFRPFLTMLPRSDQVALICEAATQFGKITDVSATGVSLLIQLTMNCGPLTCDDFTRHEDWIDMPPACVETLVPLLSEFDSKAAFYALDKWYAADPSVRGSVFNEILGQMVVIPETFALLFEHPYFTQMGWRFKLADSCTRFWTDENGSIFAQAKNARLALSPPLVQDQEEANFLIDLPTESIVFGYVAGGKKHVLRSPPHWLEDDLDEMFHMNGIDGWILGEPNEDHCTSLKSRARSETLYLLEKNKILISVTRVKNPDHSLTHYFHLQINNAQRGCGSSKDGRPQPMQYITGKNVQVRLFLMSLDKGLPLLMHPTLRQFI